MNEGTKPSNVIKGPWKLNDKLKKQAASQTADWAKKEKMAADFVFGEELTEAICVRLIQALSDNKVDVGIPAFQKYLPFINETVKSFIMKSKGYTHPLQEFVDKIMIDSALDKSIEVNYNVLDIKTIKKILKDIYGKK